MESALDELLARELPRVRSDAAPELLKMEASSVGYPRSWARELRRVETAMERHEGKREYAVQAFRLGPNNTVYFVRAEWLVKGRQGFAASLWLRTEPRVEVIETNVKPASWLRTFEFQGRTRRENLGLVLNVFDRDRDGWGEIVPGGRLRIIRNLVASVLCDRLRADRGCLQRRLLIVREAQINFSDVPDT